VANLPSKEYTTLKRNTLGLKKQFLNFEKRLDGNYTDYELTQCRTFIAFCHAEVEIYLESMSTRAIERAEKHWQRFGRTTNAISAMLAYRSSSNVSLPDSPNEQAKKNRFVSLVPKAIAVHKGVIRGNHGIGPKNLAELFIPVGMRPEQFDEPLLIQMKNLAERRGDVVHQSSQVSLPKIRDPFADELNDIEFLIGDIEPFDAIAKELK